MEIINNVINNILTRYQNEFIYVKDNQSRFIDANENFLSFFGFSHIDQIYHKTDYDLPCPYYAQQYICNDQEAMTTGEIQAIEPTFKYNGEFKILLSHKYQLSNEVKRTSGIVGISKIIHVDAIKKMLPLFSHDNLKHLKIGNVLFNNKVNQHAKIPLTERELDVLYYILHGLSQKQIADKLKLSARTVEDYVGHIKIKLKCGNKHQFFEFAIHHGLMNIIPKRLSSE